MTTIQSRHPVYFIGALSAAIAALAAETSAQSRPTPAGHLSDAIAEVLRGPFHVEGASATVHGRIIPRSVVAPAPHIRGAQIPATEDAPPRGWMFALTSLSAVLGYGGMFYLADECELLQITDLAGVPSARASTNRHSDPCLNDAAIAITGIVTTVTITAGAATHVGSGFRRSLLGSVLGFAGGWVGTALTFVAIDGLGHNDPATEAIGVATLSFLHAGITTLIAG